MGVWDNPLKKGKPMTKIYVLMFNEVLKICKIWKLRERERERERDR